MKSNAVIAVASVFLLLFCGAFAVRFYTRHDELCVSECVKNGQRYYWCWTGNLAWNWNYCSPRKNVDRYGTSCRSNHPCERHGSSYNWCYIDSNRNWEYCGTQKDNFRVVSRSGYYCIDNCAKSGGTSYYWCHIDGGWEYCSPEVGKDYYGRRCDAGSYCSKSQGTSYYWCYVNGGRTWGYCSIEGESKYKTSYGYYCSTEIQYTGDYFWCRKFNGGWDYTSQVEETDSHGRVCTNSCAKDGTSYYWCYYDNSRNWDYCGHQSLDSKDNTQCASSPSITKRVPPTNQCQRVRNVLDSGNNLEVVWYMENSPGISRTVGTSASTYTYTCANTASASEAIARLQGIGQGASTLVSLDGVRIDRQGTITRNGRRYANLQIQVNRQRRNANDRTTIATALIETDEQNNLLFTVRYIRDALLRSLRDCQPRQIWLQRQLRQ